MAVYAAHKPQFGHACNTLPNGTMNDEFERLWMEAVLS
jgi:hypothetical protein